MQIKSFTALQLEKMFTDLKNKRMNANQTFNRILYVSFVLFGIYRIVFGQFGEAAMMLGIALAFDPFDTSQPWNERPMWQKAWLILHLGICAACLGFEIGKGE